MADQQQSHQMTQEAVKNNNSSRSSSSGEEGFVSGGSLPEESLDRLAMQISALGLTTSAHNNVYSAYLDKSAPATLDDLTTQSLLSPDRLENSLMSSGVSVPFRFGEQMGGIPTSNLGPHTLQHAHAPQTIPSLQQSLHYNQSQLPQGLYSSSAASMSTSASSVSSIGVANAPLPGAWYYEMGDNLPGSGAASTGVPGDCSPIDLGEHHLTDRVIVPSSEHVAEIVGRQGCKIKALRAKTGVYVRSPRRGEDPVFEITGRPEAVMEAKREIEYAADHFTQIRASRRHSQGGMPAPGHVTAYVRVPLRVVGLVVGPKGATIKKIQQSTHTYILSPSREREPIFEVTGLPHNVETARRDIENHIWQRTGNMPITDPTSIHNYEYMNQAAAAAAVGVANLRPGYTTHFAQSQPHMLGNGSGFPGNDYRGSENVYGMRAPTGKTFSASDSPSPTCYGAEYGMPQPTPLNSALMRGVNNENAFHPGANWHHAASAATPTPHNNNANGLSEVTGCNDWVANVRHNSFGSGNFFGKVSGSTSRDEGLGDSPLNSFGMNYSKPDTYHYLSSIWSDVDPSGTHDKGVQSPGLAPQLATA